MGRFLCLLVYSTGYFVLLFSGITSAVDENCKWSKYENSPDIYYINMDRSAKRKINMDSHLSNVVMNHHRIRGLTPAEIYIPEDIEMTWRTAYCQLKTSWSPPNRKYLDGSSTYTQYSSYMSSLCGRGKNKNNLKELGCTTSHLKAIKKAVYSKSKSRYAIIIEDDVQFPFDVDWNLLAESAPKEFQILQLFNSNEATMALTWKYYMKNHTDIWTARDPKLFDFWSTCAYLIDRIAIKPIIDSVVFDVNGWTSFKVIAGLNMNPSCVPAECCINGTEYENFIHKPPCAWAPKGFQAGIVCTVIHRIYSQFLLLLTHL